MFRRKQLTLAYSADSKSEKRVGLVGCLCIDARPAVATETQTTAPTTLGDGFEYLEAAAG